MCSTLYCGQFLNLDFFLLNIIKTKFPNTLACHLINFRLFSFQESPKFLTLMRTSLNHNHIFPSFKWGLSISTALSQIPAM